jgi:uncharacterized protein YqgC (DUF456 family)
VTTLWWILAIALMVAGVIGTVVPALPGAPLVFAGAVLAAWIDGFTRVSAGTLGVLGVLMLLAMAADLVAGALGARRVGASRAAVVGAAVGTLAGLLTGLWGLVFMPLVGAAAGELIAGAGVRRAGTVGIATWIGLLLGTLAKVAIVFAMVGIFVAALVI